MSDEPRKMDPETLRRLALTEPGVDPIYTFTAPELRGIVQELRKERGEHMQLIAQLQRERQALDAVAYAAESYLESEGGPGDDDARAHLCTLLAELRGAGGRGRR